jgi:hypothetical protein
LEAVFFATAFFFATGFATGSGFGHARNSTFFNPTNTKTPA